MNDNDNNNNNNNNNKIKSKSKKIVKRKKTKAKLIMKKMILNDQTMQLKDHIKYAKINYSPKNTNSKDENVHQIK